MQFFIQKYKTTTMQRIQDSVSRGYFYHTSGQCPPEKIMNLVAKFDELYEVNLNRNQRAYRRKKGQAVVQLFIYPHHEKKYFLWWLLATNGEHLIHKRESLKDVRKKSFRLKWNDEFQLVRLPKEDGEPTWTWSFTKANKHTWERRIQIAVKFKDKFKMRQALYSLARMPGFRGIRNTSFELAKKFKTQWDRIMSDKEQEKAVNFWSKLTNHSKTNKHIPMRISYLRKQPDDFIGLSLAVERMIVDKKAIPNK